MKRFGVDAWIINGASYRESFELAYPDLDIPVLYFENGDNGVIEKLLSASGLFVDAIIATSFYSFYLLPQKSDNVILAYYVQDLETWFFEHDPLMQAVAAKTYVQRPDVLRVTKSRWNREVISEYGGYQPRVIGPSVDVDLFTPLSDEGLRPNSTPFVLAMVRPETERRNPYLTLRVIRRLKDTLGAKVRVGCFGCSTSDMDRFRISLDDLEVFGRLSPHAVRDLLGNTDVFLDFSVWQAMGLTALEAMASGAAVVVPSRGGATEFCIDRLSGLVVDTVNEEACFEAALELAINRDYACNCEPPRWRWLPPFILKKLHLRC